MDGPRSLPAILAETQVSLDRALETTREIVANLTGEKHDTDPISAPMSLVDRAHALEATSIEINETLAQVLRVVGSDRVTTERADTRKGRGV